MNSSNPLLKVRNINVPHKYKYQAGIYCITQISTGKRYIGSTNNLQRRALEHFARLRTNKHSNSKLQRSWNKNCQSDFILNTLLVCEPLECLKYETYFLSTLDLSFDFNIEKEPMIAGCKRTFSPEHCKNISLAQKGIRKSDEHILSMRLSRLGNKASQETKDKMSKAQLGRVSAMKGRKHSEETKLKMSKSHKTQKHIDNMRRVQSLRWKGESDE